MVMKQFVKWLLDQLRGLQMRNDSIVQPSRRVLTKPRARAFFNWTTRGPTTPCDEPSATKGSDMIETGDWCWYDELLLMGFMILIGIGIDTIYHSRCWWYCWWWSWCRCCWRWWWQWIVRSMTIKRNRFRCCQENTFLCSLIVLYNWSICVTTSGWMSCGHSWFFAAYSRCLAWLIMMTCYYDFDRNQMGTLSETNAGPLQPSMMWHMMVNDGLMMVKDDWWFAMIENHLRWFMMVKDG